MEEIVVGFLMEEMMVGLLLAGVVKVEEEKKEYCPQKININMKVE
jgi:hypothetical protein